MQAFGQVPKDAHAVAHNVVCTTCERCSELLTHVSRAGTGQQDNTRPPVNVFVAEGEDSRRGSVNGVLRSLAHGAIDARFEAVKNHLISLERDLMDATHEVSTFTNAFAQSLHA